MLKTLKFFSTLVIVTMLVFSNLISDVSASNLNREYVGKFGITATSRYDSLYGYQIAEETEVNGHVTVTMKTYVTPLSSFNGTCATYYKTFERYDYGNMTLRTRIYATFCFDEVANTIYVKDENGVVLFNDGWTMSDLSTSTNQGGGIITKRWASATYSFKFANVWGRPNSGSVTVKVDSAGNPLIAD